MDSPQIEEEKLCQALVGRGLLTRDEFQLVRSSEGPEDLESLVGRLISSGYLTPSQGVRVIQDLPNLIQEQIPGYRIQEKIGKGAMGTVFRAMQLSMNRDVAVKILHAQFVGNPTYLQRFHREAQVAARFSSPNIVQAIDVGSAGELHYFVMEYVEGATIKDALDEGESFSPRESLGIILHIARALEHAHRQKLVHRDVKPANIILTLDGLPKLADLGMARELTNLEQIEAEKGKTIGTPYYMAPEQARGRDDVDIRADLYSLGATWYHMLTGKPPFAFGKIEQVLLAHIEKKLIPAHEVNPKVPPEYSAVIGVLMAKKPSQRYASPTELLVDLELLEQGKKPRLELSPGVMARIEESSDEPRSFFDRTVSIIWILALVWLLGLSVGVILFLAFR
jgi:serine/threonine-protein kinase